MKTFLLYTDWGPLVRSLSDQEAGQLFKGIYTHLDGETVQLDGALGAIFSQFVSMIESSQKRYEEISEKRREAANKSHQKNPGNSKSMQMHANAGKSMQEHYKNKNMNKNKNLKDIYRSFPQRVYDYDKLEADLFKSNSRGMVL